MWYVSSLYLQQVLGLSPLEAGLTFLPMALTIMVSARGASRLVSRFGVRSVLASGLVMMASGMLLFARIGASGSPIGFVVLPGLLVAVGIGLSVVPSTIAATQGAGQAGGSRLRSREHRPPSGRCARDCTPDIPRHPVHESPDRREPIRAGSSDRWLPAALPDRSGPRHVGGGGHPRDASEADRRPPIRFGHVYACRPLSWP